MAKKTVVKKKTVAKKKPVVKKKTQAQKQEEADFDSDFIRSAYMHRNFDPNEFQELVERMEDCILNTQIEFDCIACSGVSGLMMAAPLSFLLRKPTLIVRKEIRSCHSRHKVEGYAAIGMRYIIVDDFTETGKTVQTIIESINNLYNKSKHLKKPVCVGVFMYSDYYARGIKGKIETCFKRNIKGPIMALDDIHNLEDA